MLFKTIRKTLDPARYHGGEAKPPFFEGWYFKCVDAAGENSLALIAGVHLHPQASQSHAFIQVLDGRGGATHYVRYPIEAFTAGSHGLDFSIGENRFLADQVRLEIDRPECRLQGRLQFSGLTPWPATLWSPGIMGRYAWAPFMECYHGIISLDHAITGPLTLNGREIYFDGGRGYIEKDWGRSFPLAYVWMQSNHFDPPGASLVASIAVIPWLRGTSFRGFILGLWHRGRLYRFATYTGAQLENFSVDDHVIQFTVRDRRRRMQVTAARAAGGLLHAPDLNGMVTRIAETLRGTITLRLWERNGSEWSEIFSGVGENAGVEAAGDLPKLLQM